MTYDIAHELVRAHGELQKLIIGYTCLGVFIATTLATILALFNLIKLPPGAFNRLFAVLIVEVVVISVGQFSNLLNVVDTTVKQDVSSGIESSAELRALDPVRNLTGEPGAVTISSTTTQPLPSPQTGSTPTTGPATTGNTPPPLTALPPRIYIQIPDNSQRDTAVKAQAALRNAGYVAPGIERVGAKSPAVTELRYFLPAESDLADTISSQLKAVGIDAPARFVSGFEDANIRPQHFELWFSKPAS